MVTVLAIFFAALGGAIIACVLDERARLERQWKAKERAALRGHDDTQ